MLLFATDITCFTDTERCFYLPYYQTFTNN